MDRLLPPAGRLVALVLFVVVVSLFLNQSYLAGILLLPAALAPLPATGRFVSRQLRWRLPLGHRIALILSSVTLVSGLLIFGDDGAPYLDPPARARMMTIYKEEMQRWPAPYESRFLQTRHGPVHLIVCGPETGEPLLLLHGLAGGAWWWAPNVEALLPDYRVYAVDLIGGAGKSEYFDPQELLGSRLDQADHLREITDLLGEPELTIIAAWEGAYLATNYALYAPERLKSLILIQPYGFAPAWDRSFRLAVSSLFPLPPVQRGTARWLLGDSPTLRPAVYPWLTLHLSGRPAPMPRLVPFDPATRGSLEVASLFLFSTRDEAAATLADLSEEVEGSRVEYVEGGYLINMEASEEINRRIRSFLEERSP